MTSSNGNIFRVTGHLFGNSPVTGEFPAQRPVMRSFDVFVDLRLNKRLSKQSWGWWFETQKHPLLRHFIADKQIFVIPVNASSHRCTYAICVAGNNNYNDVIMSAMACKITSLTIVYSTVCSGADQINIKAPRHRPLWRNSPVTGEFPTQGASNAENVSIWWRLHVQNLLFHNALNKFLT